MNNNYYDQVAYNKLLSLKESLELKIIKILEKIKTLENENIALKNYNIQLKAINHDALIKIEQYLEELQQIKNHLN